MANETVTPQLRCIASGRVMDKQAMVLFVAGPENRIIADVENRIPGRGLWSSAKREPIVTSRRSSRTALLLNSSTGPGISSTLSGNGVVSKLEASLLFGKPSRGWPSS